MQLDESNVGKKHGRWTQLGPSFVTRIGKGRVRVAVVECDCGKVSVANAYDLFYGTSSGCFQCRNKRGERGNTKHPCYGAWVAMNQRCHNPNNDQFYNYGARGIVVFEQWRNSFSTFIADVGEKPTPKHQLDRIDNNGNYEPGNVRWVTLSDNLRNTRRNRFIEYSGRTITVAELCEILPYLHREVIRSRVRSGWTGDEIAKVPTQIKYRRKHETQRITSVS